MITKSHRKSHLDTQKYFDFDPVEHQYVNEQVEVDGVIVFRQVVKDVDVSKQFSSFKASDFSLANQLAVGSFLGKPISLDVPSVESLADNVNNLEFQINKELNDANNSQVQEN